MQIHSFGIDLGKTTFHLVAMGAAGKVLVRKEFTQRQLLAYTANMQAPLIGLEACSGAHFLGRVLRKQGHDVRLIAAQFVKPFVKSNKSDFVDAEAIAEAVERKNMRFVPIKTDDQLDLQAIHRVRDRLISRRTAVINQLRAFLIERGLVFAKTTSRDAGHSREPGGRPDAADAESRQSAMGWKTVEQQIEVLSLELERISAADAGCTRIRKIPGIGPVVATAIVAAIGNGSRKSRRLTPDGAKLPAAHQSVRQAVGAVEKPLSLSDRQLIYAAKYEHLWPVVVGRAPVRAHVVKIDRRARVGV